MNNWEHERLFMKMNVGDRQKEQGQVMTNKCALLDQELVNEPHRSIILALYMLFFN